jgi:hypothetical protein
LAQWSLPVIRRVWSFSEYFKSHDFSEPEPFFKYSVEGKARDMGGQENTGTLQWESEKEKRKRNRRGGRTVRLLLLAVVCMLG